MSLDKYINDYLDGNLTPEDDEKLRELLSNDFSAKEEFASMLSIHSLLKSDAESISLPKELEESVEERVLANFLQLAPIVEHRRWVRSRAFVTAFATIFFILFVMYVIDDSPLTKSSVIFLSELNKQEQVLWNSYPIDVGGENYKSLANLRSSSNLEKKKYAVPSLITNNQQQGSKVSELDVVALPIEQTINSQIFGNIDGETVTFATIKPEIFSNDFSSSQNFSNRLIQIGIGNEPRLTEKPVKSFNQLSRGVPFVEFQTDELLVSTFSSRDIMRFGMQNVRTKGFGSLSQSIGYKINKNQRFGMEFGYSEFTWDENSVITVQLSTIEAPQRAITTMKNSDVKGNDQILTNGESSSNPLYVEIPVQLQRERQVYWGSLFYEYYYPMERIIAFAGRLNIGATSDGPFGAVRLYSEIEPIRGVALNLGIESRTLWARMPYYKNGSFRTSIGLIYGLSLKFNFE